MIKKICMAGDSHTWGEGAADYVFKKFSIPVCAGEKRLLPFSVPSFPTLLRNYINKKSGSEAAELSGSDISRKYKIKNISECACVCGELCIDAEFDFARVELMRGSSECEIFCDEVMSFKYNADKSDEYEVLNIMPKKRASNLRIKSSNAMVYRVEFYKGKYAVLNCGIGSCPSFRYTEEYLDKYVLSVKPSVVLTEIFTVNDWLSQNTPAECEKSLVNFGERVILGGAKLAFSSVIPILGNQINEIGINYAEYIHAGERAAHALNVPYADVYRAFSKEYDETSKDSYYGGDCWHPGARGHEIYFKEIKKLDIISELC